MVLDRIVGFRAAGHQGRGEVYLRLTLHIADTDRQARDEAERSIMSGYRTLSTRLENSPNRRRAAEAEIVKTISYEEVMRDKVIIGSAESVVDRLAQLDEELGLDGILAELNFGALIPPQQMTRSLQLLCEDVMPRLQ